MKGIALIELSELSLRNLLTDHGTDICTWGQGEAKTCSDLLQELDLKESLLRVDRNKIQRVIRVAKLFISSIHQPGKLLHEDYQIFKGRRRERNQLPAGKIAANEDPFIAATRELKEELNLTPDQYSIQFKEEKEENRPSKSYPNLDCVYELYFFTIQLQNQVVIDNGFTQMDTEGTELHFSWK